MKTKSNKISDNELASIHKLHVQQESNDFATKFKENGVYSKLIKYGLEKYIRNNNLQGSDIAKMFTTQLDNKTIKTKDDIDLFFEHHLEKNIKNMSKLVNADELHVKEHPSKQDNEELQEDKTKLKLLKYIDTKWFNPDNLKERKIKLLKNRVIKRINSGEFLHKKEVNKYIKDYYTKL